MFWKGERDSLRRRLDDANYAVEKAHRAMQKSQHTIFNQTKALVDRKVELDRQVAQNLTLAKKASKVRAALEKSQDEGQKTLKQLEHVTKLKNRMQSERDKALEENYRLQDRCDDLMQRVGDTRAMHSEICMLEADKLYWQEKGENFVAALRRLSEGTTPWVDGDSSEAWEVMANYAKQVLIENGYKVGES
jgi:predicted nuclease with TOPRIM domain